ncbi:MAG: RNA polymerase sigma factor [Chloroflexi bacterium]|nr:RNA polymerase sigma factor [Chloroflexota bacterium]MCI0578705.1 RNA polymerase sigma factor [Chloroflexota bacterium]MCI0648365.1 RNA polymerase sigma factor [Chloroflexota bacterium]MCI0730944.1 RNA polymerase sigma factor [Chloroflexota bacterium]
MTDSLLPVATPALAAPAEEQNHWLARCLAGEEGAYLAVYNQYAGLIYRLCYSLLQHQEDAEEVLQDTFEYTFRKLANFDGRKSSFKTWLYRIAISRCRNKRRRKWLPTLPLSQLLSDELPDHETPTPDEALALSGQQKVVWEALAKLSPKLRETAVLRYYEGLSYNEIGDILGIPAKTAESRMRLAHKALRELLVTNNLPEKPPGGLEPPGG